MTAFPGQGSRARAVTSLATSLAVLLLAFDGAAGGFSASERLRVRRSGRVDPAVIDALETGDAVRVLIVFSVPDAAERARRRIRRSARARSEVRRHLAARRDALLRSFSPGSFELKRSYGAINALAGSLDAAAILRVLEHPYLVSVGLDRRVSAQLAEAVPLVALDSLHARGRSGSGVRIAILDTGVDRLHADLSGAVVAEQCFCSGSNGPSGCCPNGLETDSGTGAAADDNGHGTEVAGTAASRGSEAAVGAAPDVEIVAVKVLDSAASGFVSDVVAGLDWIVANRPDVDLVNLSLGSGSYAGDCDAADAVTASYAAAIDTLRANGVLTIAGSGNSGWGTAMIAPACIASAVSVGAVWDADLGSQSQFACTDPTTQADQVACYSNSSTTTDLFAPGSTIRTSALGGGAVWVKGTSFATPMVTGCAAVLLGVDASLGPDALETALKSSPTLVTDATNGLSFPRLDCLAARLAISQTRLPSLTDPGLGALLALLLAGGLWALRAGAAGSRRNP